MNLFVARRWWCTPLTQHSGGRGRGRGRGRGNSVSSGPIWSTERVPGQPGLHRETLGEGGNLSGLYFQQFETENDNSR